MRRSALRRHAPAALLLALLGACAHVEPPTGGPEDKTPPRPLATRPDTLAVVPSWRGPVVFVFEERISEQRVEDAVLVSPRTSPVAVDHSGDEIRVSLRRGWQPGVVYHVTVQPTIQDLFGNRLAQPVQLVFSTGPAIPTTRFAGTVIDRITGKPEVDVRVEAIRRADSLVYAVPSDSAGRFDLSRIPEGEYLVRAFRDMNRNRSLEPYEPRDTVLRTISAQEPADAQLAIVAPDTTAPRATGAQVAGERRVEVRFDDYLDPGQPLAVEAVEVVGPGGESVPLARVSLQQAGAAPADTLAAAVPVLPSQTLILELAEGARLVPGATYRVRVRGATNVVGLSADAEAELEVPAAEDKPPAAPAADRGRPRAARFPDPIRTRTR